MVNGEFLEEQKIQQFQKSLLEQKFQECITLSDLNKEWLGSWIITAGKTLLLKSLLLIVFMLSTFLDITPSVFYWTSVAEYKPGSKIQLVSHFITCQYAWDNLFIVQAAIQVNVVIGYYNYMLHRAEYTSTSSIGLIQCEQYCIQCKNELHM